METFLLWITGFWGQPGYTTVAAAKGMLLFESTIKSFEDFTKAFMTKYFGENFLVPTQSQIIEAWHAKNGVVVYTHTPFGDEVSEMRPDPSSVEDPLITKLTRSQLVGLVADTMDIVLEKHGIPVK